MWLSDSGVHVHCVREFGLIPWLMSIGKFVNPGACPLVEGWNDREVLVGAIVC